MDIKAILTKQGVPSEFIDSTVEALKVEMTKEFVSKKQYERKRDEVDTLNSKIADLEIDLKKANTDEYKAKYEELEKEYNDFKTGIETEKINTAKSSTLREQLKAEGFNEKMIKLLEKNFDLETIEIEEDKIKGWEDMIKPIREEYADFIPKDTQTGNPPATPPTNVSGKTYTADMLKNMSAQEIAKNYDAIRQNLN